MVMLRIPPHRRAIRLRSLVPLMKVFPSVYPAICIKRKLDAVWAVTYMVVDHRDLERRLMGDKHTLHQRLREELRVEK